jgi:hypothetical protein
MPFGWNALMFVKFLRIAYRTTQKTTAAGRPHARARFRRFQVGAKDTPGRLIADSRDCTVDDMLRAAGR